jgi:hypothetical protein
MCSPDNIHIKDGEYLYTLTPYCATEKRKKTEERKKEL